MRAGPPKGAALFIRRSHQPAPPEANHKGRTTEETAAVGANAGGFSFKPVMMEAMYRRNKAARALAGVAQKSLCSLSSFPVQALYKSDKVRCLSFSCLRTCFQNES